MAFIDNKDQVEQNAVDIAAIGDGIGVTFEGEYDVAGNSPNLQSSPVNVTKGQKWIVGTPGTFFTTPLILGDIVEAKIDDPIAETDWIITKYISTAERTTLSNTSGTNTGDQVIPVDSVNTKTGAVVLDADDIDDSATAHKFVTAGDITNLSNLSGTNTGDEVVFTGTTPVAGTNDGNVPDDGIAPSGRYLRDDGTWNVPPGAGGDPDQNLWETISSDSGNTVANSTTDTLTVTGGTSISTAIAGDTLTINNDDPNADHTGDATGATALTLQPAAITGKTLATIADTDLLLFVDSDDSQLKRGLVSDIAGAATDADAFHKSTEAEINALTPITTISETDVFLLEDASDPTPFTKKKVNVENLRNLLFSNAIQPTIRPIGKTRFQDAVIELFTSILQLGQYADPEVLPAPFEAYFVYDSTDKVLAYYDGASWKYSATTDNVFQINGLSEIQSLTEKTVPANNDAFLFESAADSFAKRTVDFSDLQKELFTGPITPNDTLIINDSGAPFPSPTVRINGVLDMNDAIDIHGVANAAALPLAALSQSHLLYQVDTTKLVYSDGAVWENIASESYVADSLLQDSFIETPPVQTSTIVVSTLHSPLVIPASYPTGTYEITFSLELNGTSTGRLITIQTFYDQGAGGLLLGQNPVIAHINDTTEYIPIVLKRELTHTTGQATSVLSTWQVNSIGGGFVADARNVRAAYRRIS
jgi:hypothetical protein